MTLELRDLTGTVVAITGGAGGIGSVTIQQLVDAGARVAIAERAGTDVAAFAARWGDAVAGWELDVRDPAQVQSFVDGARSRFGRLDSVVANAGAITFGNVLDYTDDEIRAMVETNFLGYVWLCRAAVRAFRDQGSGGDVIIVGSQAGLGFAGAIEAVYAGTKAAQMTFASSLDKEVRGEGIRVSTVAPAAVNTKFAASPGRFTGPIEDAEFIKPDDIGFAIVTMLRQPRRIRTSLWGIWSTLEEI